MTLLDFTRPFLLVVVFWFTGFVVGFGTWLYIDMAGFSFFFLVDIRRGNGGDDVLDVVADEVFDVKGV